MKPIAHIRTDLPQKFGIPRNSFLAPHLRGRIVFEPECALESAVAGIESLSHLWLIWQFENGVPGGRRPGRRSLPSERDGTRCTPPSQRACPCSRMLTRRFSGPMNSSPGSKTPGRLGRKRTGDAGLGKARSRNGACLLLLSCHAIKTPREPTRQLS